jgi:hypothetical protein
MPLGRMYALVAVLMIGAVSGTTASLFDAIHPAANTAPAYMHMQQDAPSSGDLALVDSPSSALAAVGVRGAPFPCTWTAPSGEYFDFSGLTTATGTVVHGTQSDVYNVSQ